MARVVSTLCRRYVPAEHLCGPQIPRGKIEFLPRSRPVTPTKLYLQLEFRRFGQPPPPNFRRMAGRKRGLSHEDCSFLLNPVMDPTGFSRISQLRKYFQLERSLCLPSNWCNSKEFCTPCFCASSNSEW